MDICSEPKPSRFIEPELFQRVAGEFCNAQAATINSSVSIGILKRRLRFLLGLVVGDGLGAPPTMTLDCLARADIIKRIFEILDARQQNKQKTTVNNTGFMTSGWRYDLSLVIERVMLHCGGGGLDAKSLLAKLKKRYRRERALQDIRRQNTGSDALQEAGLWVPEVCIPLPLVCVCITVLCSLFFLLSTRWWFCEPRHWRTCGFMATLLRCLRTRCVCV